MNRITVSLVVMAAAVVLTSCKDTGTQRGPKPSWAFYTHVTSSDVEYYLTGPQQARPPDGTIPAGTRVNIVEDAGSYVLIETEGSVRGYVSTSALKPLTSP